MPEVDIAIVGAGPTGLFAAYYAGFRGLSTAVIDALPEPGGQVTAMYPEKDIFDVAGFPVIKGRDWWPTWSSRRARSTPSTCSGYGRRSSPTRRRPAGADPDRRRACSPAAPC